MTEPLMPIRCLIVEDNSASIAILEDLFKKISFIELIGICTSAMEAIDFLRSNTIDLIISDIEMSGVDGLHLVKMLKGKYEFILISGFRKDQAVDAFELGVVDYIWKPVMLDRFLQALMAYQYRVGRTSMTPQLAPARLKNENLSEENTLPYIMIKNGNRIVKVPHKEILYIRSHGYYICYHLASGSRLEEYKPLKDVEDLLEGKGFWRIHKSYIINSGHVSEISRNRKELALHTGDKFNVSRGHLKKLANNFDEWETRF